MRRGDMKENWQRERRKAKDKGKNYCDLRACRPERVSRSPEPIRFAQGKLREGEASLAIGIRPFASLRVTCLAPYATRVASLVEARFSDKFLMKIQAQERSNAR